ncbi:uncharacterized protein LOC127265861 [Andrographis paniculata]|uniref:uncharacterized protein LOC127265861 n=1 Tax=Andrographis paniculata TaxID=175694 RepID=UPI0021E88DDE|nr:uncharacterized protein LOC127265861 [Andrographis paniculata]
MAWLCIAPLLTFFLLQSQFSVSVSVSVSLYNHSCSSVLPLPDSVAGATFHRLNQNISLPTDYFYFTGGDKLLRPNRTSSDYSYLQFAKSLKFPLNNPYIYETTIHGVYQLRASLYIRSPYHRYYNSSSYTSSGRSRRAHWYPTVRAFLSGFWSEHSRKLCMVGSATWQYDVARGRNLDVVLKLSYAAVDAPTMPESVVAGTFESTSDDDDPLANFDPISIFSFPRLPNYQYSLVTEEFVNGGPSFSNQSLSLPPVRFCSTSGGLTQLQLWYPFDCNVSAINGCSPLGPNATSFPLFVSLNTIQCSEIDRKIRYMITFQNGSYQELYQTSFDLRSTWIGEGSWDEIENQVFIVACRILDPTNHFGEAVGDCSMRLRLRYASTWNIRNVAQIVGQIWTNKTVNDSDHYFRKIELTSVANNGVPFRYSQGLRYEYTETDRVRKTCVAQKNKNNNKIKYPNKNSHDMRFDMNIKNSKGQYCGWGGAIPISIGNQLYGSNYAFVRSKSLPNNTTSTISYKINIQKRIPTKNLSTNPRSEWEEIIAEGVYDDETGHLCMIGCRELPRNPHLPITANSSKDCEILLDIKFPSITDTRGGLIKGKIRSTRPKQDPLFFDDLTLSSSAYYLSAARKSVSRMEVEIGMVLACNTLLCIFVAMQLLHIKKNTTNACSGISIAMLAILSLGQLTPLVLNFEAVFFQTNHRQRLWGSLETNEVAIRAISMLAFLLQIRLLQLVWTAKANESADSWLIERKSILALLSTYAFGAFATVIYVMSQSRHAVGYYGRHGLRSYGGLILDGFLLPQVLLNAVGGRAAGEMLSPSFYAGITVVRLVPHAYDVYRAHSYPVSGAGGSYYFANPAGDFYSTGWDVVIPCGMILMAAGVFMQQRYGGRCILPVRFRGVYEKVAPAAEDETQPQPQVHTQTDASAATGGG